jgi:transcriptional regulator with PAS, ATPase and Fis domain
MNESAADAFRWQSFFQHAAQPMFLVNRRRRVLFVNRAWESCTSLKLADVRGRSCRRRSAPPVELEDAVLSACAPPAEAMEGRTCQVRRRAPASGDFWEIQFVPIAGKEHVLGILGILRVLTGPNDVPAALPDKLMALRDRQAARYRFDDPGADSPALARLHEQVSLAASTHLPITLVGESGTGKEWLARAIHNLSAERQRYFACLDAERLPPAVLGDVLFGPNSRRIGFGTIYLREPASLPREWQERLAESIKPDGKSEFPRFIAGFRRDPRVEIQANRLLEAFYCAVSPVTIVVPPLRERLTELLHFIDTILQRCRELAPHSIRGVGAEAMNVLRAHAWPGNLRELSEVLREMCGRVKGERIELADLPYYLKQGPLPAERRLPLDTLLEQVERRLIALALKLTQNNQTRAAELLEVWRPRLMRRMEKFGLNNE